MMSINPPIPDYELADRIVVTTPAQLRAMADPLRVTILDLLLERAATVAELAAAVQRPKSTVAHHVNVLVEAGMLRVVRTRTLTWWATVHANALSVAAAESVPAHEADQLRTILRHARIPAQRAAEFWERVDALTREFAQLPRSGDTMYGFAAGLYPTDYPTLPDANDESSDRSAKRRA